MSDSIGQRETKHMLSATVEAGDIAACKPGADLCKFWGAGLLRFVSDIESGSYTAELHFLGAGCETCAAPDTVYPDESGLIMSYCKDGITNRDDELAGKIQGAKAMLVDQLEYMTARNGDGLVPLPESVE